ncbi:polyprenyl synthetase family protein [Sulfurospirillum arcachonense]|uniref:polyprenyl synthetase family protein n=1 Tax=Sulfurospirillum arcachonense TaxID=57666 RepID=UPI000562DB82|nr:polyprenyl synthetase family protein [Sulfurospirillum arcachonense]
MKKHIESIGDSRSLELYEKVPKGKRLRAKLILKIANQSEEAIELASIVELIHAASLLHDDVIDEADTRRGVTSINHEFGNMTAIMLGDILYSKGFTKLTYLPSEVARSVADAVTKLSVGELLDVELASSFNTNQDIYFDMIYKKTASLIEAAAFSAAYLAKKDTDKYALYGKNLGLAFQVIDDVLDITSSSEILGKPALNDFREGKTTLPYLYMYEKLNNDDKTKLLSLFAKDLSFEESSWIKEKFEETGSVERSIEYAKALGYEALKAIEKENAPELEKIIKEMIVRDF